MVPLSVLGLTWCEHAGWMVVLLDATHQRRLQVTLPLEDAVLLGQELSRRPTDRAGLLSLLRLYIEQSQEPASIQICIADTAHAAAALVIERSGGAQNCPLSMADAVAVASRTGLALLAEEELMQRFAVAEPPPGADDDDLPPETPIPKAFRLALVDPPSDDGA